MLTIERVDPTKFINKNALCINTFGSSRLYYGSFQLLISTD